MSKWLLRFAHVSEVVDADLPSAQAVATAVIKGQGPQDNVHLSGYWSDANPLQGVVSLEPGNDDNWQPLDGLLEPVPQAEPVLEQASPASGEQTVTPSAPAPEAVS